VGAGLRKFSRMTISIQMLRDSGTKLLCCCRYDYGLILFMPRSAVPAVSELLLAVQLFSVMLSAALMFLV